MKVKILTPLLFLILQASNCIAEENTIISAIESGDYNAFKQAYETAKNKNSTTTEDGVSYPLLSAVMAIKDPRFFELAVKFSDPNFIELGGLTPIFTTPIHCSTKQAKSLVEHGADINHVADVMHLTPLHMVAASKCYELAAFLVQAGASKKSRTKDGKTPADIAREKSDARMLSIVQ